MKRDNLTVLSLFGGMECGRITLDKMGITPKKYYSSEIDKFARKEVAANYPCVIQLGDVTKWREWDIDWASIDLLIGGSPCQGFSFAGKQLAFDDPRSALFFVYVDILNHVKSVNPDVKFMLENVRMKKEYLDVITEYLGVEPVFINSEVITFQSRPRYYWSNWLVEKPKIKKSSVLDFIDFELKMKPISEGKKNRVLNSKFGVGKFINRSSEKCGTLIALYSKQPSDAWYVLRDDGNITLLSVTECCRLQGVPDNYFKVSSNTQAYKMLGNGWQCDTIEHIFNCLFKSA